MKKVLALVLAVAMMLTLNVGALAADTVKAIDSGITLSHTSINILPGKSFVLIPTLTPNTDWPLVWTSSDKEIVTVDDKGVLTAIKVGRATVTAAGKDNAAVSASCVVNVVEENQYSGVPVQSVGIPFFSTVRVGNTRALKVSITPANATNKTLIWTSDDEEIVTVDDTGKITGVSEGRATVRATSEDGNHWSYCEVTVIGADAPVIQVDGSYLPGQRVWREMSVNTYPQEMGKRIISEYDIVSCRFEKGLLKAYDRDKEGSTLFIAPATPRHAASDVGTTIEDTLFLTLSNGETYTFPVIMKFTSAIDQKLRDKTDEGSPVSPLVLGKSYNFTLDILDAAGPESRVYRVKITEDGDSGVLQIGEITVSGKTVRFPVTPLRLGTVELFVKIEWGGEESGVGYPINVIPEDTEPVLTPGSFDKDDNSDNDANSSETLADIAAANEALSNGTDLPKEVVDALTASGATVPVIPVKLTTGSANLYVGTADLIGSGKVGLLADVNNGAMTVLLPGGFGKVNEPGRVYYPLDFEGNPKYAADMLAAVKGDGVKSEAVKAGGSMTMPATVTVTLKTKLTGTVNIYLYNEDTGKFTLLASPAAKDGTITFATRQMGYMVLTTGRI